MVKGICFSEWLAYNINIVKDSQSQITNHLHHVRGDGADEEYFRYY